MTTTHTTTGATMTTNPTHHSYCPIQAEPDPNATPEPEGVCMCWQDPNPTPAEAAAPERCDHGREITSHGWADCVECDAADTPSYDTRHLDPERSQGTIYLTVLDSPDQDESHLAYTTYEAALADVRGHADEQPSEVRWLSESQWECIGTETSMWVTSVEVVR